VYEKDMLNEWKQEVKKKLVGKSHGRN